MGFPFAGKDMEGGPRLSLRHSHETCYSLQRKRGSKMKVVTW